MKVFDLTQPDPGPALRVEVSSAAELLMSMCALSGEEDFSTYDLGESRMSELRSNLAPDLIEKFDRFTLGLEKVPAHLLGLVLELPKPWDAPALIELIQGTDPLEIQLNLFGCYARPEVGPPKEVIVAAAKGDVDAAEQVKAVINWKSWHRTIDNLVALGAEEVKKLLVEILPRWYEDVYLKLEDEALPSLKRDAEAKRALAGSLPAEKFIETATNGIQFVPTPAITELVVFPTYWLKPWVLIHAYKETKIYCAAVSDEALGAEGAQPPPNLVKLYKALGDAGRLRLLRRLAAGALTLAEAAEELEVGKSTAHHHLAQLRQAGLVFFREDDDRSVYTLREDMLEAAQGLRDYLKPR